MRAPLVAIYGEKYFQDTWSSWIDAMRLIFENKNGDVCQKDLRKIKCPSLIVHGEKDAIVFREHPDYLKANITNSKYSYFSTFIKADLSINHITIFFLYFRVQLFKAGGHNLHLRYADEFNALVHEFLLGKEDSKL